MEWRMVIVIHSQRDTDLCSPDYQHNELHSLQGLLSDTALAPGEEKNRTTQDKSIVFAGSGKTLNLICWNKNVSKEVKLESLNRNSCVLAMKDEIASCISLKKGIVMNHRSILKVPITPMTHLFQYAFIKKLLQLFVTIVDAELLEAVVLKILWTGI